MLHITGESTDAPNGHSIWSSEGSLLVSTVGEGSLYCRHHISTIDLRLSGRDIINDHIVGGGGGGVAVEYLWNH